MSVINVGLENCSSSDEHPHKLRALPRQEFGRGRLLEDCCLAAHVRRVKVKRLRSSTAIGSAYLEAE